MKCIINAADEKKEGIRSFLKGNYPLFLFIQGEKKSNVCIKKCIGVKPPKDTHHYTTHFIVFLSSISLLYISVFLLLLFLIYFYLIFIWTLHFFINLIFKLFLSNLIYELVIRYTNYFNLLTMLFFCNITKIINIWSTCDKWSFVF